MPIHEKSLIRPENIETHDNLVIDGVDVSGHWSTFIKTRVVDDYNESLQDEIAALPGQEETRSLWRNGARIPWARTISPCSSIPPKLLSQMSP